MAHGSQPSHRAPLTHNAAARQSRRHHVCMHSLEGRVGVQYHVSILALAMLNRRKTDGLHARSHATDLHRCYTTRTRTENASRSPAHCARLSCMPPVLARAQPLPGAAMRWPASSQGCVRGRALRLQRTLALWICMHTQVAWSFGSARGRTESMRPEVQLVSLGTNSGDGSFNILTQHLHA